MLYSGSTHHLSHHSRPYRDPDRLCFGSGSGLDPVSVRSVDTDPDSGKKKKLNIFQLYIFFFVIKTLDPDWIRIWIGIQPKMLDPEPDLESLALCLLCCCTCVKTPAGSIQLTNRKCRRESTLSMTLEPKLAFQNDQIVFNR